MQESLALFTEVVKNPLFKNTPIFVFLNKKDLFEEMIPKNPLKVCFPEYTGPPNEVRPALEFIEKRYKMIMQESVPGKPVYVHIIAARLRMDMKIAFGEVKQHTTHNTIIYNIILSCPVLSRSILCYTM